MFSRTTKRGLCRYWSRPVMLPAMTAKPQIAIIGAGRWGSTLALELARTGYQIREIVSRGREHSTWQARALARRVRSRAATMRNAKLGADVVWFCVPDAAIRSAARELALVTSWKGKIALHSSGALDSDELRVLKKRGAAVASVHPFMTFVRGSAPSLRGVPFGVEGDSRALRMARRIVGDLSGQVIAIPKTYKVAYHAWGTLASPLLVALLVTAERVARAAGLSANAARKKMTPIIHQTLENYLKLGPAAAFSGPIVRGDVEIIRRHLRMLRAIPEAWGVYKDLARAALRNLPVRNRKALRKLLGR
jgi:predicted short-subunit dehydrogenase-like oxidoreductase (DUF2520 family)